MRIQLVILDTDHEYLRRLSAHLAELYPGRIDVHAYSDLEGAIAGIAAVRAHAVLVGAAFDVSPSDLPARCAFGRLTDSPTVASIDGVPAVARYTKTSEFFRQVIDLVSSASGSVEIRKRTSGKAPRLIVTTSAAGGSGTTSLAAALARSLAMQPTPVNVLYLDLDPTSDAGATLETAGADGPTMSDVIYAIKRRRGDIDSQLMSVMRRDAYGVHHFAATRDPADILDLTADDRAILLERLTSNSSIDVVILDIPFTAVVAQWSVLEHAHRVLLVARADGQGSLRTERARRILERLDATHESSVVPRTSLLRTRLDPRGPAPADVSSLPTLLTLPDLGDAEGQVVDQIYASGALHPVVSMVLA
ncbi:hypothetical protein IGS67_04640 [Flavimobilis sp. GY10621]|uniref:TadZ-like receiver domain-containing protein n=1 Tax=Flavimobilis rhizosphaerae TaxID=2775421 RepID=A0ABR9DNU4_9MICO|nr:hypothetical protein [Flavimobilis rhizosphaerae]MBD9698782.1 hypothetical protein [Flavimobilis rhizosphaerae]